MRWLLSSARCPPPPPVHPGTDNITIPEYVAGTAKGELPPGTTPPQVAQKIDWRADAAMAFLESPDSRSMGRRNPELAATFADFRAMALLGKYYAAKIRGATALAPYRRTKLPERQAEAVGELTRAAVFFRDYTTRTAPRYRNPLWTNRVGSVDWRELGVEVANDIAIARRAAP